MALPLWGLLSKAQDDAQTINEAIASAIVAHEEDPTAHLGVGESLQEHKHDEVIDHPAESVVQDKLTSDSIVFNSESFDRGFISDLSAATLVTSGSAVITAFSRYTNILVEAASSSGRVTILIYPEDWQQPWALDFDVAYQLGIGFSEDGTDYDHYISLGDYIVPGYGTSTKNTVGFRLKYSSYNTFDIETFVRVKSDALYTYATGYTISSNSMSSFRIKKIGDVFYFYYNGVEINSMEYAFAGTTALYSGVMGSSPAGGATGSMNLMQTSYVLIP